jgi:hypothetical protein
MSDEISAFVGDLGFVALEHHQVYIHATLTREIVVYEKQK